MPILIPRKNITILDPPRVFLVRDDFTDNLAAGAVDATSPTPGPGGERTVVDTDGDGLSVGGGTASFANPNDSTGNPGLWYGAQTRAAGSAVLVTTTPSTTSQITAIGWDENQITQITLHRLMFHAASNLVVLAGGGPLVIGTYTAVEHSKALVLRATGCFYCIKGGVYTDWTLVWTDSSDATATLYPGVTQFNAVFSVDTLRVAQLGAPWSEPYAIALGFATFTAANGTALADYTPEVGPIAGGGANWDVQTNEARNSPVAGGEIVGNPDFTDWTGDNPNWWSLFSAEDGTNYVTEAPAGHARFVSDGGTGAILRRTVTLTVGAWYTIAADITARASGSFKVQLGSAIISWAATGAQVGTGRCLTEETLYCGRVAACDVTVNSMSVKPLTLSDFISGADYGYSDVLVNADLAVTAQTQAGVVACLDDLATPANFLLAYHDGTNAHLEKCVAGVYTSLVNTAAAYAANAPIRIIKDGTSVDLFYNNVKIGATQTVNDAGIMSNTIHAKFSTFIDNRVDNLEVWPRHIVGYARQELEKYAR